MVKRSEAKAIEFLLWIFALNSAEIEAQTNRIAERSEAEALEFLLQIWPEIKA